MSPAFKGPDLDAAIQTKLPLKIVIDSAKERANAKTIFGLTFLNFGQPRIIDVGLKLCQGIHNFFFKLDMSYIELLKPKKQDAS